MRLEAERERAWLCQFKGLKEALTLTSVRRGRWASQSKIKLARECNKSGMLVIMRAMNMARFLA